LQDLGNAIADGKEFSVSEVLPAVAAQTEVESPAEDLSDHALGDTDTEIGSGDLAEDTSATEGLDEPVLEATPSIDPVLAQVFRKETVTHLAALNEYLSEI
jgi:hypothetical protein